MLFLQFDRMRDAWLRGEQEKRAGGLEREILVADRNPAVFAGERLFFLDLQLAVLPLHHFDLFFGPQAEDQVRLDLQLLLHHLLVGLLRLDPRRHFPRLANLPLAALISTLRRPFDHFFKLGFVHIQNATVARPDVRAAVHHDDRVARLVGRYDGLCVGVRGKGRSKSGMVKIEGIFSVRLFSRLRGIVFGAPVFGVHDRERRFYAANPGCQAQASKRLSTAGPADEVDPQADVLADGRAKGEPAHGCNPRSIISSRSRPVRSPHFMRSQVGTSNQ